MQKPSNQAKASKPKQQQQQQQRLKSNKPRRSRPRLTNPPSNKQTTLAAAYATGQSTQNPSITSTAVSCRIRHRELITKVVMTANFAVVAIKINPGLNQSFPWLSSQANAWETYRFNALRFRYYTRVGSSSTGSVIMAPDYDASDTVPLSEQIASSFIGTVEDVAWKDILCTLRPEGMHALGPKKYTRFGDLGANQDIKTFDVGTLFICTVDGTPGPAGNIWAEYDITFSNPQLPPSGVIGLYQRSSSNNTATTAFPFGTVAGRTDSGTSRFVTIAGGVLTFTQAGRFSVDYFANAATSVTMTSSVLGGGATSVDYGAVAGSGTLQLEEVRVVDVVVGSTITYAPTFVGAGNADLNVSPYAVVVPY